MSIKNSSKCGCQDVAIQDQTSPIVNLYTWKTEQTPSLTSGVTPGDTVLNVDSSAGISNGDAITLFEDLYYCQSIVKSTGAGTITVASPITCPFTTAADLEVGPWNANLDGSSGAIEFHVHPPSGRDFDIYTITITMLDQSAMDDALFGGITALTNGLIFRHENGHDVNLALVTNNKGFYEQGFDTEYAAKAPAGYYGFQGRWNIPRHNGVAIRLSGSDNDKLCVYVQDDLQNLVQVVVNVAGHVVVY